VCGGARQCPRCYQYRPTANRDIRGTRAQTSGYCDQCASSYRLLICRPLQLFGMAGDLYYSQRSVRTATCTWPTIASDVVYRVDGRRTLKQPPPQPEPSICGNSIQAPQPFLSVPNTEVGSRLNLSDNLLSTAVPENMTYESHFRAMFSSPASQPGSRRHAGEAINSKYIQHCYIQLLIALFVG